MNWKAALQNGWGKAAGFLRDVRWRDPLVQVRAMALGLVVTGIAVHYVRRSSGGEQKNAGDAFTLLHGAPAVDGWRPSAALGQAFPELPGTQPEVSGPDLRAAAQMAAAQPGWTVMNAGLRRAVSALQQVERITVKWSGTRGGDAGALDLYASEVRGSKLGLDCDFLIGNGIRGEDGVIETTRRWQSSEAAERREICICLVGTGGALTAAQTLALGELITSIEAGSGRAALAMHQPERPGLLADTN